MKLFARLFVVLFTSWYFINGSALGGEYTSWGPVGEPGDAYLDGGLSPLANLPYDSRIPDGGADYNGYGRWEGPRGRSEFYRLDQDGAVQLDPYLGRVSVYHESPSPERDGRPEYCCGPDRWSEIPGRGYVNGEPFRARIPRTATRGFSFRGESPAELGGPNASEWRHAYRFRPLNEQERRRMDTDIGWRPRGPEQVRARSAPTELMPGETTYDYEPSSWFRRYYGERP